MVEVKKYLLSVLMRVDVIVKTTDPDKIDKMAPTLVASQPNGGRSRYSRLPACWNVTGNRVDYQYIEVRELTVADLLEKIRKAGKLKNAMKLYTKEELLLVCKTYNIKVD